jgi:UDP-N-acetylglucosamine 4-epimerase
MYNYQDLIQQLKDGKISATTWLVTGCAGFIGSNIVENLLKLQQTVIGIDNFSTGRQANLDDIRNNVLAAEWENFTFYQVDITDKEACAAIFKTNQITYVLHHAAISSVPYSIKYPEIVKHNNIDGFVNILQLSCDYGVQAFIYASSSSVYGDNTDSSKLEGNLGNLLSPYADSKFTNEKLAQQYSATYPISTVGLRYFNIYGKRQDPNGAYAAVIPKWIDAVLQNKQFYINGDGSTTRDFLNVDDVVQANILACLNTNSTLGKSQVYNVGSGQSISLNDLSKIIIITAKQFNIRYDKEPGYRDFVDGDIRHSCANIGLVQNNLNFYPQNDLEYGITKLITSLVT